MYFSGTDWIPIFIVCFISAIIKTSLGFFELGIVLLIHGWGSYYFLKKLESIGVECLGRFVDFVHGENSSTPVIEFITEGNKKIKGKPFLNSDTDIRTRLSLWDSYDRLLGNAVYVLYYPSNPRKFIIADHLSSAYFRSRNMSIIGVIISVLSLCHMTGLFSYLGLDWV